MKKVRIAVVGAGLIGYRHIEDIRKNPECELSSLVAPKPPARIAGLGAKAGLSARTLGRRFFSAANVPAHFRRCRETRLHSRSGAGGMNDPRDRGESDGPFGARQSSPSWVYFENTLSGRWHE